MYGEGISNEGSIVDVGVELEIIRKSGAWYSYEGTRIGQGRENAKLYLLEHQNMMEEVERKVRAFYQLDGVKEESQEQAEVTE